MAVVGCTCEESEINTILSISFVMEEEDLRFFNIIFDHYMSIGQFILHQ